MPDSKVRVLERLFAGDSFRRIKVEHLGQQIYRKRVGMREELLEWHARLDGKRADIILCARRADTTKGVLRGRAQIVKDLV